MVGFPNLTFDKRLLLVEKNCFFLIHLLAGVIISLVYTDLCSSYQDLNIVFQNLKLV